MTQPAPETDDKKSRGLGSYVLWALVAVIVYVLSSGPVFWTAGRLNLTDKIRPVYYPLVSAYEHSAFRKPLGIYWHLWWPNAWDKNGEIIVRFD